MEWQPLFYEDSKGRAPVRDFILAQPEKVRAAILRRFGAATPAARKVDECLRELRVKQGKDYYHLVYCALPEGRLLLHVVRTESAMLPPQDIELAETRLALYLSR